MLSDSLNNSLSLSGTKKTSSVSECDFEGQNRPKGLRCSHHSHVEVAS